jgi:outer membrane murein-binding lipoprotein Lpp
MAITINVSGETATEVLKDLREISGALLAGQSAVSKVDKTATSEPTKIDVDRISKEVEEEAEEKAATAKKEAAEAKKKADAAAAKKKAAAAEKKKAEEEAAVAAEESDEDEEESQYTLAEVRKKATEIIKLGLKDEVQGLIKSLGFEGLSKVTPDKFDDVMAGLEELEALA